MLFALCPFENMSQSPFLARGHWPLVHLENTSFHYFSRKYSDKHDDGHLFNREEFLNALNTNPKFSEFWAVVQEQHPARKGYFLSLIKEEQRFDPYWLRNEYLKYSQQKAFDELSEEDKRTLQSEFDGLRPAVYQAALKGEALRLNCDISKVRPTPLVLPWKTDSDEESPLVKLPDDVFGRIISQLDTIDVFRMTLVCRSWKSLIHNNTKHLKRAEHAVTTHMITFTDWMDPAKTPQCSKFLRQYQLFSWYLVRWQCGISESLETLILDHEVPHVTLATLLQSCPNLRHLRIGHNPEDGCSTNVANRAQVQLKKLEVLMSPACHCNNVRCVKDGYRQLNKDILISSPSLRVFRGSFRTEDFFKIGARNPRGKVFDKLVALDLEKFTSTVLAFMTPLKNLQLKYFGLGYLVSNYELYRTDDEERARNSLHQLLPNLSMLEMLRTSRYIGVTNKTIQLMTDLKLNINWAVLYHACPTPYYRLHSNAPMELDPLQPEVLDDFRSMLLLNNPEIDLSEIRFILHEGKTCEALEAMNTGFTILETDRSGYIPTPVNGMYDPKIKQQLGIDY